jgi:hypothetical protein
MPTMTRPHPDLVALVQDTLRLEAELASGSVSEAEARASFDPQEPEAFDRFRGELGEAKRLLQQADMPVDAMAIAWLLPHVRARRQANGVAEPGAVDPPPPGPGSRPVTGGRA